MKAKIVAIVNQKGGVGKSTTALALTAGLFQKGYKVLAVDTDAQANLSFAMKASSGGATALGVLTGEVTAKQAVQKTEEGDVIPSNRALAGIDAFLTEAGQEYRLKESLEPLLGEYDFIIVDTPPALGILTINALSACTSAVVPVQADIFSLQGVEQLAKTVGSVKNRYNSALALDGLLLTRYSARGVLSRDVAKKAELLAERLGTRLFKSKIREAIVIKEAQLKRVSIFSYAPNSNVALDYKDFLEEFLTSKEQ